jgi:putative ABC transport system permease protein
MPDSRRNQWRRLLRLRSEPQGDALPPDVLDELLSHLADAHAAELARGASEREAMAVIRRMIDAGVYDEVAGARRAAAAPSRLVERTRARVGRAWLDVGFDLRYAVRTMRRQVPFTAAVVTILAVGIGATTAAWAVLQAVVLNELPYPAARELVVLRHASGAEESRAFSPADWLDYARHRRSFRALAAFASWPMNLTGAGEPERLRSVIVSGGFFDVAGVRPALGRLTGLADDTPAAPAVVVLGDGFWRRRFAASPSVLGTAIRLNGQAATVVGVMPSGFALPTRDVDLWMPMSLSPEVLADRDGEWLSLVGRLQPGTTIRDAAADLSVTAAHLAVAFPRRSRDRDLIVRSLLDEIVGGARRALWLAGLAALIVLLAAGANAANLLLARATVRRDELAVRAALGADPMRLARQLLTESALLAAIGGAGGVGLAWAFLRLFQRLAAGRVPRLESLALDGGGLLAAAAAALLTAAIVGGAAAWLLTRPRAHDALRAGPARATRSIAIERALLATQVAFATVLVTSASLVARSYLDTVRVDPGFDTSDTMTMQLTLPKGTYADNAAQVRFASRAEDALSRLPGVSSAGVVSDLPFVANATHFPVSRDGEPADAARLTTVRLADPGFFATLRVPLVAGRRFAPADRAGAEPVAILNRTAAVRYEAGAAVGQRLRVEGDVARTVVGIVADIRHAGLLAEEGPVMYVPYAQKPFQFLNWMGIVVRSPESLTAAALRAAIAEVDPNQPIQEVRTMAEYVARESAPFRFSALVTLSLAAAALLLAVTGVYGLTAFAVGLRSREFSLRIALGAPGASIVGLVLRQTAGAVAAGAMLGAAGSVAASRVLRTALAGTAGGFDGETALAGLALVVAGAAFAALRPALRAARLDPTTALHSE